MIFPPGFGLGQKVEAAVGMWSTCNFQQLPPLEALEGPGGPLGGQGRPIGQNVSTSINIQYDPTSIDPLCNPQVPEECAAARWDKGANTIKLFGRDAGGPIDWTSEGSIEAIAHEIGHALGLGHDTPCTANDGLMRNKMPLTGSVVDVGYCSLVEFVQSWRCTGTAPPNPVEEEGSFQLDEDTGCPFGCTCEVEPVSPVEDLVGRCQLNPYLCEEPGERVWWNDPFGRVARICRVETTCDYDPVNCPTILGFEDAICCYGKTVCRLGWVESELAPSAWTTKIGPTVSLLAPTSGASLTGLVEVRGVALQRSPGVRAVTFWVDNQRVAVTNYAYGLPGGAACSGWTDPSCPNVGFSATIDTRLLTNGSHQLQVVADDLATITPEVALVAIPITVSNCVSTRSPTAVLTAPASGATLQGTVTLSATASDDGRIDRVEFFINGNHFETDSNSPFSKTWSTVGFPNGTVTLTAKAYDMCGNSGVSAPVTATVNNVVPNNPPQVWIDAPAHNANVTTRNLAVYGWATDNGGVPSFTFTVDGQPRALTVSRGPRADVCNAIPVGDPNCPNVGWGVTLDTYGLAAGAHTIAVTAIDNLGATASVSRAFQIVNASPTAWVGYPNLGRTVSGSSINVVGWARDTDGVGSVRLEIDNQPVSLSYPWARIPWLDACSAGSPLDPNCPNVGYKMNFNSLAYADGYHSLKVIVRDTRGVDTVFPHSLLIRNNPVGTKFTRSAIADTFIQSALPASTTGGTSTQLIVKGASNDYKYSFLKFDLSGISGQVVAARLKLVPKSASASRANLWRVTTNSWTESTLNWNGLSGLTFSLFDVFFDLPTVPGGTVASIDVTDMVSLGGMLTFGISTDSLSEITFASREYGTSSQRPVLEVWTH